MAAGDTVALAIMFADKYNDCATTVELYDFAKNAPLTAFQAGCADLQSLVVDDEGFRGLDRRCLGCERP